MLVWCFQFKHLFFGNYLAPLHNKIVENEREGAELDIKPACRLPFLRGDGSALSPTKPTPQ